MYSKYKRLFCIFINTLKNIYLEINNNITGYITCRIKSMLIMMKIKGCGKLHYLLFNFLHYR